MIQFDAAVQVSKMNANTCKVIISEAFGSLPVDEQKALAAELIGAVQSSTPEKLISAPPAA